METSDGTRSLFSRRRVSILAAMMLAGLLAPSTLHAQAFPEKRPITLVVPFAAGGGTDALAREMGRHLEQKLGQPVIIDNRGGAGGTIAGQMVARAKPDGHTLFFVTGTFITAAAGDQKLPYDVLKDFAPIALIGRGPMLVVVNKDLNITTIPHLIEQAKAKPEAFNFVSSGPGSILHLAGELFVQRTGAKMTHIPYKGGGPAVIDLLSGQAQVMFSTVPTILGHIKSNKVQLLAVTTRERSKLFPDTPTVMEAGVKDYDVSTWWGVVGPAGLSPQVVAILNQAVNDAAASEGMQKRFQDEGAEAFRGAPADLAAHLQSELASWRKVVKDGGLKFE